MSSTWRLILSLPASGVENMALDEAILESVSAGEAPPTIRLYAWEPPCLSIGYAQPAADIDLHRLEALGWDWVRRPTGGRAILHTDEVTYSIAAPNQDPIVAGGVLRSYRRLSAGLAAGLALLGLTVEIQPKSLMAPDPANPVCFETPSAHEITVGRMKLIGSAQVRRQRGVLQHGSLPLEGDLTRVCLALRYGAEASREHARERLLKKATTVHRCLGRRVTWSEAAEALASGFSHALGLDLVPAQPTAAEQRRAEALAMERYANPSWAERR
jgi:lipoate-protein ligase A